MNYQFLISDSFSENYFPFFLYRYIIKSYLDEKNLNFSVIYSVDNIIESRNNTVFIFIYCVLKFDLVKCFNAFLRKDTNIVIINTEHYANLSTNRVFEYSFENAVDFFFLEYNTINYNYFLLNYPSLNIYFLPPTYHKSLNNYYLNTIYENISFKPYIIPFNEKDIDIFMFASPNPRRMHIIGQLSSIYKVHLLYGAVDSGASICHFINRSKIVLNIMYYDYNIIFDYFRLSFLYSINSLVVTEKPDYIDLSLQPELNNMDDNVLSCTYDKIIDTVHECIKKKSDEEIKNLIDKQNSWFSNNLMEKRLDSLFDDINNIYSF